MSTFFLKNLRRLFDKYAVARTEHDALVKSTTKIFSNFVAFSENPNFMYKIILQQPLEKIYKIKICSFHLCFFFADINQKNYQAHNWLLHQVLLRLVAFDQFSEPKPDPQMSPMFCQRSQQFSKPKIWNLYLLWIGIQIFEKQGSQLWNLFLGFLRLWNLLLTSLGA